MSIKKFSRAIAIGLCAALVTVPTTLTAPTAFAAEQTVEMKASSVKPGNAYIPQGTQIEIELQRAVSSKTARVGDEVKLKLVNDLYLNDVIVAKAGTEVIGVVSERRKAGGFGRGGKLEVTIESFKALNGVEIPLEFSQLKKGSKDSGAIAVAAAASVVGGFFMKGKNISFEKGTKFVAEVATDADLEVKAENLAWEMSKYNK